MGLLSSGRFEIYTDGSCLQKEKFGSWAFVIRQDGKTLLEQTGIEEPTTSNEIEFRAATEALLAVPEGSIATVFTDSRVVVDTMTLWIPDWKKLGWVKSTGKPIPSVAKIRALDELCQTRTVQWKWVKSHSGHEHNERCDELCRLARIAFKERT